MNVKIAIERQLFDENKSDRDLMKECQKKNSGWTPLGYGSNEEGSYVYYKKTIDLGTDKKTEQERLKMLMETHEFDFIKDIPEEDLWKLIFAISFIKGETA